MRNHWFSKLAVFAPNLAAVCLSSVVISLVISYSDVNSIYKSSRIIYSAYEIVSLVNKTMEVLKESESSQRGYIITGDSKYLNRYGLSKENYSLRISRVRDLLKYGRSKRSDIDQFEKAVNNKIDELNKVIEIRKSRGFDEARDYVRSDVGFVAMKDAERISHVILAQEESLLKERKEWFNHVFRRLIITMILLWSSFFVFMYFVWMTIWTHDVSIPKTVPAGDLPK